MRAEREGTGLRGPDQNHIVVSCQFKLESREPDSQDCSLLNKRNIDQ